MPDQSRAEFARHLKIRRLEAKLAQLAQLDPDALATIELLLDALVVATPDETDLLVCVMEDLPTDLDALIAAAELVLRRHEGATPA